MTTPAVPGAINVTTLTGQEIIAIATAGPQSAQTTVAAIAAMASGSTITSTSITTVGAGTLTAAGLIGGMIVRTGPVAAYTDTTATAAQIVTALGAFTSGEQFRIVIKNATAFTQTLAAASGVTLPLTVLIGPMEEGQYWAVVGGTSASPTVTLSHYATTAIADAASVVTPQSTALSSVGAGSITAAGIAGGITTRGGSQSATPFTDTTDTAANIIAASVGLVNKIGASFLYTYINNTNALATITGSTGVTVSQGALATTALVPAGMTATFLLTYTAAATITMVCTSVSANIGTALAMAGTSSGETILTPAAAAAGTLTLPAVTGTVASTTGSNLYVADVTRCTAPVTVNGSITYVNVTGLQQTVVVGTYRFRCVLPSTVASGTGGIKYAFHYTTTVVSALEGTSMGYTASAVAVQHTTTTTDVADLFTQAAVVIMVLIEGTMTVSTGGTINLQMAQNTSNGSNTVALLGGSMEFVRIA